MKYKASVVYLTRNGGKLLEDSLASVFAQKTDFSYEVIAIDSGSTDGTIENMRKFSITIHGIAVEKFNFGLTRDYGFEMAQGEIVVVLSQDALPVGSNWLQCLIEPFHDESIAVVQGMSVVPEKSDIFFWEKIGLFYYTRDAKQWLKLYSNIGLSFTNCAIRRSVWCRIKIGKAEMSEDKVFQRKIVNNGYKIVIQKCAYVAHAHGYSFKSLVKRCVNEGLGWREVGIRYSFFDMIKDIFNVKMWIILLLALCRLKIKGLAEALFPIIRPLCLYKGNKYEKKYVR